MTHTSYVTTQLQNKHAKLTWTDEMRDKSYYHMQDHTTPNHIASGTGVDGRAACRRFSLIAFRL